MHEIKHRYHACVTDIQQQDETAIKLDKYLFKTKDRCPICNNWKSYIHNTCRKCAVEITTFRIQSDPNFYKEGWLANEG